MKKISIWSVEVLYAMQSRLNWRSILAAVKAQGTILLTLTVDSPRFNESIRNIMQDRGWEVDDDNQRSLPEQELRFVKMSADGAASVWDNLHVRDVPDLLEDVPVQLLEVTAIVTQPKYAPMSRWAPGVVKDRDGSRKADPPIYLGNKKSALAFFKMDGAAENLKAKNLAALREAGEGWGAGFRIVAYMLVAITLTALSASAFYQPLIGAASGLLSRLNLPPVEKLLPYVTWASMFIVFLLVALTQRLVALVTRKRRAQDQTRGSEISLPAAIILLLVCVPVGVAIRELFSGLLDNPGALIATVLMVATPYLARGLYRASSPRKWVDYSNKLLSGTLVVGVLVLLAHWPMWAFLTGLNLGAIETKDNLFDSLPWIAEYFGTFVIVVLATLLVLLLKNAIRPMMPLLVISAILSLTLAILDIGLSAASKGEHLADTGRAQYTTYGYPAAACLEPTVPQQGSGSSSFSPAWIISVNDDSITYTGRAEGKTLRNRGVHLVPSSEYRVHLLSPTEQNHEPFSCSELAHRMGIAPKG